jgi:3-hydroxyacyl-CoA dehydrogenase
MDREGFAVPEKIDKMIESGAVSFYRLTDGVLEHYDFSTQRYQPVQVSPNILSLKNLKAAEKTVKTCPSATLVDLGDGVFCCEFHTKMNAINDEIIEMLHFSLDHVDQEGAGLVVGNQAGGVPGAFSAGADLFLMAQLAMQGRFPVIEEYVKKFQDVLQRIKYAPFPVVAAPFGLTLGGGCELCLSTDRIVAHADLYMGLVEIGVGLLPAGGGCLNLWRKLTAAIPESVTDVELGRFFVSAFTTIATAKVSASAADARSIGFLGPSDRIVFNKDYLIGEAKKEAAEMAFEGYAPPVKRPVTVMGMAGQGMANAEVFNMAQGGFISEYDAFLARHIARVISGGDVRDKGAVTEDVILALEREAFMTFWKESKTHARVEHMLKTGKPLRN